MSTSSPHFWFERGADLVPAKASSSEFRQLCRAIIEKSTRLGRTHLNDYKAWVEAFDQIGGEDKELIRARIDLFSRRPRFSLLLSFDEPTRLELTSSIESLQSQLYPNWELCAAVSPDNHHIRSTLEHSAINDDRIKLYFDHGCLSQVARANVAFKLASGDYLAILGAGDQLPVHCLYMFAEALETHPSASILYSDEDKLSETGQRQQPHFKPDWNPDLIRSCNFVGRLAMFRRSLGSALGGFRQEHTLMYEWDLVLRASERLETRDIFHLPYILYHKQDENRETLKLVEAEQATKWKAGKAVLEDALQRAGEDAEIASAANGDYYRCQYHLPTIRPMVSILLPSHTFSLLSSCIKSILQKTTYRPHELIVIDTGTADKQMLGYLAHLKSSGIAKVIRYDEVFNWGTVNNLAAREASGEVLCLLNDDVEVIEPTWLEEMVSHALRPSVGAVGAKLLYPDDTVQHAGFICGIAGVGGHAHRHFARESIGYQGRAAVVQNFSAVTGACLVIRKALYSEVGGLDDVSFAMAADIDLCLRLVDKGYRIVWTPYALLYHHESRTRGIDDTPQKRQKAFGEAAHLWNGRYNAFLRDPSYNPNLTLMTEDFSLSWSPRIDRPWEQTPPPHRAYIALEMLSSKFLQALEGAWSFDRLDRLLDLEGGAFINAVYNSLLGRPPDPQGFVVHLARLKHGVSKIGIIRGVLGSLEAAELSYLWAGLPELLLRFPVRTSDRLKRLRCWIVDKKRALL